MNFLQSIFDAISDLFSKILDLIKRVLPYILLGIALFCALGIPLTFLPGLAATNMNAAILAGSAFLFAPEETAEILTSATHAIGDVAQTVVGEVVDVVSTAATGILSSPGLLLTAAAALAVYLLFIKDDSKREIKNDSLPTEKEKPLTLPNQTSTPFIGAQPA